MTKLEIFTIVSLWGVLYTFVAVRLFIWGVGKLHAKGDRSRSKLSRVFLCAAIWPSLLMIVPFVMMFDGIGEAFTKAGALWNAPPVPDEERKS